MAKLVYAAITSLDGYVADEHGRFDWSMPDEEVHAFVNDLERSIGTSLYGRGMYEVLVAWETMQTDDPVLRDYQEVWRAADKIVFSSTLEAPLSERTRIERSFDPDLVRSLKTTAPADLSIGGPTLAAQALRHGVVDELHLFVNPVIVGGGLRALPDGVRLDLELLDTRRFSNGVVHLHHRVLR